jgi:hypothetical protein
MTSTEPLTGGSERFPALSDARVHCLIAPKVQRKRCCAKSDVAKFFGRLVSTEDWRSRQSTPVRASGKSRNLAPLLPAPVGPHPAGVCAN